MESPNSPGNALTPKGSWALLTIALIGMVIFAALYFLAPKRTIVVQTASQTLTNEVSSGVPTTPDKTVTTPAAIPEDYLTAMEFYQKINNATYVEAEQVLFKLRDVRVEGHLNEPMKSFLTEDQIKAKFELTLRKYNVPVNPNSEHVLVVSVGGNFQSDFPSLVRFTFNTALVERQWLFREGECHTANIVVWEGGESTGTVGRDNTSEGFLKMVEKSAEVFANAYLSANPKP